MGLHEKALARARKARAEQQTEVEAQKQLQQKAFKAAMPACRKGITAWMSEIGMTPQPEVKFDMGSRTITDAPPGAYEFNILGYEPIAQVSWIFDNHHYRAICTYDGTIDSVNIWIAYRDERVGEGGIWSEVRGQETGHSISDEIDRIGNALLTEKGWTRKGKNR